MPRISRRTSDTGRKKEREPKVSYPRKPTPLEIAKKTYGSKEELVSLCVSKLEKQEHESKDDFKARLSKVSSSKLMNLLDQVDQVEKMGGKDAVIDIVYRWHRPLGDKVDEVYRQALGNKSLGSLLDEAKTIERRRKNGVQPPASIKPIKKKKKNHAATV